MKFDLENQIQKIQYTEFDPSKLIIFTNGKKIILKSFAEGGYSTCFEYNPYVILCTTYDRSKEILSLCTKDLKYFPKTKALAKNIYYQECYQEFQWGNNTFNDHIVNELLKLPPKTMDIDKAKKRLEDCNISYKIKEEFHYIFDICKQNNINQVCYDPARTNFSIKGKDQLILRDIFLI